MATPSSFQPATATATNGVPICVTGAGGYLGSFVVSELLRNGHDVHGTVRDPTDPKNAFLLQLGDPEEEYRLCGVATESATDTGAPPSSQQRRRGRLTLFAADLGTPGSFHAAVEGCEVVIHTAAMKEEAEGQSSDPQRDFVDPMLAGTTNVVGACIAKGVRRIVYTSSVVTILQSEKTRDPSVRGKPLTEDEWVPHLSPTYGTYSYTKVECEKLLGRLWDGELVSLLPPEIIGPVFAMPLPYSHSFTRTVATKECGPYMSFPGHPRQVDVRDVARAHVFAAEHASLPSGRYNLCGPGANHVPTKTIAEVWNKLDSSLRIPTRTLPEWLPWLASFWDPRLTPYIVKDLLPKSSSMDVSRLLQHGFEYRYDLEAMHSATLATFRKHKILPC